MSGAADMTYTAPAALMPEEAASMTTTVPAIYAAISACTSDLLAGVAKGRKNDQQNYRFRGIDDFLNALAPVIARHKVVILPRVVGRIQEERRTKSGGSMYYTSLEVEYDMVSAEDGSKAVCVAYGEAMDSADKSTNKAMSAAYKYMAMQAFCIPIENMADADATTPEPSVRIRPIEMPQLDKVKALEPAKDELKARLAAAKTVDEVGEIRLSPEWQVFVREPDAPENWIAGLKRMANERVAALP